MFSKIYRIFQLFLFIIAIKISNAEPENESINLEHTDSKQNDTINLEEKTTVSQVESIDDEGHEIEKDEIVYKTYNKEDILFQLELTREINLKEEYNAGFFSPDREITEFIIRGILSKDIPIYKDWSKKEKMTISEFKEKMHIPQSSEYLTHEEDDSWDDEDLTPKKVEKQHQHQPKHDYFFNNQVSMLILVEDLIFHRRYTEWSLHPKSMMLVIPKEYFETGVRRDIGVVDYHDVKKYLDSIPEAQWVSDMNAAENIPFTLAIEQRRFSSLLTKYQNPKDLTAAEMYGAKTAIERVRACLKAEQYIFQLMDRPWVP